MAIPRHLGPLFNVSCTLNVSPVSRGNYSLYFAISATDYFHITLTELSIEQIPINGFMLFVLFFILWGWLHVLHVFSWQKDFSFLMKILDAI